MNIRLFLSFLYVLPFFPSGERGDICAGDDVVVPSLQYPGDTPLERGTLFVSDPTGGAIPYFEDYTVEVCNKTDVDCMARCFDMSSSVSRLFVSKPLVIVYTSFGIMFSLFLMS
jgi:hypothetical protein